MQKRIVWACLLLIIVGLAAVRLWSQAQSQERRKPPVYTYVSEWAVPRAQWADYTKLADQGRTMMDKFVADGTIINQGEFVELVHHEGHATHGNWFSATSMANLMKVLNAEMSAPSNAAPVLANSKHWDFVLVSRTYNGKPGNLQNGYLVGASFLTKPGQERNFRELIRVSLVPILEKMLSDGAITSYAVEYPEVVNESPSEVTFVYTAADASGIDRFDAAIEAAVDKDPAFDAAFNSAVEPGKEHDFLARITFMNSK